MSFYVSGILSNNNDVNRIDFIVSQIESFEPNLSMKHN